MNNLLTIIITELGNDFRFSIRPESRKSVNYLTYLMLVGVMTSLAILHYPVKYPEIKSPLPLNAFTFSGHGYKEPTLNPDISEREQNKALIKKIWGKDSWTGLNIARCESGYRTKAENHNTDRTVDQGVFQVNSVHGMPEMFNSVANISYAYVVFKEQGTNPWTSSQSCWGQVVAEK